MVNDRMRMGHVAKCQAYQDKISKNCEFRKTI